MVEYTRNIDPRAINVGEKKRILLDAQLRFDAVGMPHPADQPCPLVAVGHGITRAHLEPYLARGLRQQTRNDAQRRGFAGAIGTFQRHHLSGGDRKAEIAKNAPSGAFAGQVFHLHEAENGHQSIICVSTYAGRH